jgi:cyclic-di-AMP phosphodiesterase PgpH
LIPTAMGIILIAVLFNHRLALLSTVVFGLLTGLVTGGDFRFIFVALLGGLVAIYGVYKVNRRDDLAKAGLYVAALNAVAIVGLFLFTGEVRLEYDFFRSFSIGVLAGVGNGLISAVMAIGLLPYLEAGFGLTTSVTAAGAGQPQPEPAEAPPAGSSRNLSSQHHHGQPGGSRRRGGGGRSPPGQGGGLLPRHRQAEAALFLLREPDCPDQPPRADLGQLEQAHHHLPYVKDGVEIGRRGKLPQVILDIIQQHHGTSLVTFFYMRAAENHTDREKVEEASFRYEGPKPHSKEAAIVMLADSVEAAVRSMVKPTAGKVETMVRKITREKLNDGQLDESNLTLGEVDRIVDTFIHILSGIFHTRIEYPEMREMAGRGGQWGLS